MPTTRPPNPRVVLAAARASALAAQDGPASRSVVRSSWKPGRSGALEEKVAQPINDSPVIDRFGVPACNRWNECLDGIARAGSGTVFPETIGTAATGDADFLFRAATAISEKARAAVREGGAGSVMHAHNSVYGQPAVTTLLRQESGFNGHVASDCDASGDVHLNHKAALTAEQGVSMAVKAGTDLTHGVDNEHLPPAVPSAPGSFPWHARGFLGS